MLKSVINAVASVAIAALMGTAIASKPAVADMHTHGIWGKLEGAPYQQRTSRRSYVGTQRATRQYTPNRRRSGPTSSSPRRYSGSSQRRTYPMPPRHVAGVGKRPGRWCGWWMRTQKGGGPEFNVAWNWRKYGRAVSRPQVGAVVVWRHHVGMITGRASNGRWIVKSGNDGNRVRERPRSVKGAIFRM